MHVVQGRGICMDDTEQVAEEVESLTAIYGEDFCWDSCSRVCEVWIPDKETVPRCLLRLYLPGDYPSTQPPVAELSAAVPQHLSTDSLLPTLRDLEQAYQPGEVVLFSWVEAVKEQWQQVADADAAAGLAAEEAATQECAADRPYTEPTTTLDEEDLLAALSFGEGTTPQSTQQQDQLLTTVSSRIVSGEPHTINKSTFQAHVAPVGSVEEVHAMVEVLRQNKKIRAATHNIMAYRIPMEGKPGCFYQDFDDDGEAAAGGRLLHMLQAADVSGVAVVVSRWFGGVLLGPARFGLINNTARDLLTACGYISSGKAGSQHTSSSAGGAANSSAHGHGKGRKAHHR